MPSLLPPLSQSKKETMDCPYSYVVTEIEGRKTGPSTASERGTEVHHVMAEYVWHCTQNQLVSDWVEFNRLAKATGIESGSILDGLRDHYEVQWDRVYGVEITMMLDEDLNPTLEISEEHWPKHIPTRNFLPVHTKGGYVAHIGTADVVMISEDGRRGKLPDYKSHLSPFDADTYQGILYSFMLMKHLPELQQVTFELIFVRYQNCTRAVTYKRSDMPEMQQAIMRSRERQVAIHENPDAAQAIPCKQCSYCPLGVLTLECPIREQNPMINVAPEDRLRFKEWTRRMNADNTPILKAHAEVHGAVCYVDGNGKRYEYGSHEVPQTRFPLDATAIMLLGKWLEATGENLLDGRLNVSSTKLKGLLKAKKRMALLEQFEASSIETSTKPKWSVRTPDEGFIEDYNPYGEE